MSNALTFRDFAAAVMSGQVDRAGEVLQSVLGLAPDAAASAAKHFQNQMATAGQPFMMKAMGLRTAVAGGSDADVDALLGECFGLAGDSASAARQVLRAAS